MLNSSAFLHLLYPNENLKKGHFAGIFGKIAPRDLATTVYLLDRMRSETKQRRPGHQTLLVSLFIAVVTLLSRYYNEEETHDENWGLNKVIGMMKAKCRDNMITVPDYAKASGMSPRTLLRRFKTAFDMGPAEYLQCLRIDLAKTFLQNSSMTNEAIAYQCGFNSSGHMWKVFRDRLNCSPSDLRSRKKQE